MKLHSLSVSLLLASAICATALAFDVTSASSAHAALNRGEADRALGLLNDVLQQSPNDSAALNLRCRVYYAEELWDEAIADCAKAAKASPADSSYHLWLARAYGEKASRVNFVTAYKLARQTRTEFEAAANLDPHNGDALADLGEFYVEAPPVLGGGTNKAQDVAQQLSGFDAFRAHELAARIAEQKKDYSTAEQELHARIESSHSPALVARAWMDLGSYYRRRSQYDQMQAALERGAAADTGYSDALVDGASTLLHAGRRPDLAAQWMEAYLAGNSLSEDAPAFTVLAKLGDLYRSQGDETRAAKAYASARSLASGYAGARQAGKS